MKALLGDYACTAAFKLRAPLTFEDIRPPSAGFKRAVRGIDPETGHDYDDTRRCIDAVGWLGDAEREKIFSGNVRRVYPRFARRPPG